MDIKPLSQLFESMIKDQLDFNVFGLMGEYSSKQREDVNSILAKALRECYLVINNDCNQIEDFQRSQTNILDLLEHVSGTTNEIKKHLMQELNIEQISN